MGKDGNCGMEMRRMIDDCVGEEGTDGMMG